MEYPYKASPALAFYIDRIGAEQLNFRTFMVKERSGNYYTERCLIKLKPDGTIECSKPELAPNAAEEAAIKSEFANKEFPRAVNATNAQLQALIETQKIRAENLYAIRDRHPKEGEGTIIMVQQKIVFEDGSKAYLPWACFSDGEWRRMEPEGALPFWKPEKKQGTKIAVHEGAKAARYCDWLINSEDPEAKAEREKHPWIEGLSKYEHWGLLGGALAPHRANYSEIRRERPTEVLYICDNDDPGLEVASAFSEFYGGKLKYLSFDFDWPQSFDLADPMPEKFRSVKSGRWIGPAFEDMIKSATFATEKVPVEGSKKPAIVLRRIFSEEWFKSVKPEFYIHQDRPDDPLGPDEFNNEVRPFSHTKNTSELMKQTLVHKAKSLEYNPSKKVGVFRRENKLYINTHIPPRIKPEKGDVGLFINYINGLIPIEKDRDELIRWCATLSEHPEIKMNYGVLLVSEMQGVGKSTLGEKILAPLVGIDNFVAPTEKTIVDSSFNSWIAHKRLALVNEIYAGNSNAASNKLKSVVTEKTITINKKFVDEYTIENWVHLICCSNSIRALKLDLDDRRWFVPRVSEEKRPNDFWIELNDWLKNEGGHAKIKWWLADWLVKNGGPVLEGAESPSSTLKEEMNYEQSSDGQKFIINLLDRIRAEVKGDIILLDTDLVAAIRDHVHEGRATDRLEKPMTVRKLARKRLWFTGEKQIKFRPWDIRMNGPKIIANRPELASMTGPELHALGLKPLNVKDFLSI